MSFGSTAYESYVRILEESGQRKLPSWSGLSHLRRLAWEAAAQAVALAVLPASLLPEPLDGSDDADDGESAIDASSLVPQFDLPAHEMTVGFGTAMG